MKKSRGFTLVEIIVALLIATIVMGIATTLILNSMGYFNKTAVSDNDKQVLDSISRFVSDELRYASQVRITDARPKKADNTEDTEWKWMYIDHDILYRDSNGEIGKDVAVFDENFYSKRKLEIVAKGYDSYRLDLSFALIDINNETVYTTKSTLELLNLKVAKEKTSGFTPIDSNDTDFPNNTGMKIYYKKGVIDNTNTDVDSNGTVADETKKCNPLGTNANPWVNNTSYNKGDFVKFDGIIYRAIGDTHSTLAPNVVGNVVWKRVYNANWDTASVYDKDDIVIFNGEKYICKVDIRDTWNNKSPLEDTSKWDVATKTQIDNAIKEHEKEDYCGADSSDWTVGGEAARCSAEYPFIKWPDSGIVNFPIGSFVNYKGKIYRAIQNTNSGYAPDGNYPSLWKKIDTQWDVHSVYYENDIVQYPKDGLYYQVKHKGWITVGTLPTDTTYWNVGRTLDKMNELLEKNKNLMPTCDLSGTAKK